MRDIDLMIKLRFHCFNRLFNESLDPSGLWIELDGEFLFDLWEPSFHMVDHLYNRFGHLSELVELGPDVGVDLVFELSEHELVEF